MSPEMMRCPFCGAIPDVGIYPETDDSPRGYFCVCPFCSASTAMSSVEAEAIGVWNRRFTAPARGDGEEPTAEQIKQLAIKFCDIDEFGPLSSHPPGTGDFNPRWAEFALGYDDLEAPHSGDCLKQPWTCTRCLRDEYEQKALAALRIAAAPAAPAGDGWKEPESSK